MHCLPIGCRNSLFSYLVACGCICQSKSHPRRNSLTSPNVRKERMCDVTLHVNLIKWHISHLHWGGRCCWRHIEYKIQGKNKKLRYKYDELPSSAFVSHHSIPSHQSKFIFAPCYDCIDGKLFFVVFYFWLTCKSVIKNSIHHCCCLHAWPKFCCVFFAHQELDSGTCAIMQSLFGTAYIHAIVCRHGRIIFLFFPKISRDEKIKFFYEIMIIFSQN